MQFRLPESLQVELIAYDPKLKALAKNQSPNKPAKKSKYPLGNVQGLIPFDIINQNSQQAAVDFINTQPAANRCREFFRVVNTEQGLTSETNAFIYHYEQLWFAAWLPPVEKKDEYVYGYSFMFKDTATSRKAVPRNILNAIEKYERIDIGRSSFFSFTCYVTKEDIASGNTERHWRVLGLSSYYAKSRLIHTMLCKFEEALKRSIPTWSDSRDIFERLSCNCIADVLLNTSSEPYWNKVDKQTWIPSANSFYDLIDYLNGKTFSYSFSHHISTKAPQLQEIKHIISKPFFRKWIQTQCDKTIEEFNNPNNNSRASIVRHWRSIGVYLDKIHSIYSFFPDCPIDFYQTHLEAILTIRFTNDNNTLQTKQWIRKYMPTASFFNLLSKYYQQTFSSPTPERGYYITEFGIKEQRFHHLIDSLSMLDRILSVKEIEPPKRWRIEEFHDYVQAESWKIQHKNESLPQNLFPVPVHVQVEESKWTFIQPVDTHQLATWGQAVRNCVGAASHYASDIRKKKHFIVLCMVDNKPQFTVQLKVDMGLMSVTQIAGVSNARLADEEKEMYTKAFGKALKLRESTLQSQA